MPAYVGEPCTGIGRQELDGLRDELKAEIQAVGQSAATKEEVQELRSSIKELNEKLDKVLGLTVALS